MAEAPVEQLREFSGEGLIAGTLIHGTISIFVGLLYAISLPMFPRGATWRSGLVTPLLWSGLVASTLGYVNPTLNSRIDWGWFVGSQIAFGLAAAHVVARTAKISTMQNVPFVERPESKDRTETRRNPSYEARLTYTPGDPSGGLRWQPGGAIRSARSCDGLQRALCGELRGLSWSGWTPGCGASVA